MGVSNAVVNLDGHFPSFHQLRSLHVVFFSLRILLDPLESLNPLSSRIDYSFSLSKSISFS